MVKMKRICHIALILFGFFMIATTVFGWSHRIRLLDRNNDFCPSEVDDVKDLLIQYQRKWWAFPLFASWDYTADPVYEFYNSTFPNGRRRHCPFYRPDLGYRSGEGKCGNCYRIKPFSKRRTEADSFQTHWGLDVHAPEGTPLIAAANGIVKYAGPWSQDYFMYDPEVMEKTFEEQEFNYYCADSTRESGGGHEYGNVFLIYYPCWDITVMYSHVHEITAVNPFHQDIEYAAQYEDTSISSGHVFGNVGHSGNASSDTARMHVDVMFFVGEISLDSTGNKDTAHLYDPHDWMYEKSVNTEVTYYRRRQRRYCL
ncbi:MAG: M23 family metallopeptidase [bacterium]